MSLHSVHSKCKKGSLTANNQELRYSNNWEMDDLQELKIERVEKVIGIVSFSIPSSLAYKSSYQIH